MNPDLITADLVNDDVDELGPADREALQAPPEGPVKKKKKEKKAKEVKKPLSIAVSIAKLGSGLLSSLRLTNGDYSLWLLYHTIAMSLLNMPIICCVPCPQ